MSNDTIVPDGFKRCGECKEVKPRSEFYKAKGKKDGLVWCCKKCKSLYAKQWLKTGAKQKRTRQNDAEVFWSRVDISNDETSCWEWKGNRTIKNYGTTSFNSKNWFAHRLAWKLTYGDIPKGLFVCHHCDNPPCCNPSHLFLGTPKDNAYDMIRKGRSPTTKLDMQLAREIKIRYELGGVSLRQLAKIYGVKKDAIYEIVMGRTWKQPQDND